jgi:dipeptidyl-peptidase-4
MRVRTALAGLLALALLRGAPAARGDDPKAPPSAITLERLFGGKGPPLTRPLPDWSWRPEHAELVDTVPRKGRATLVAMDAESGAERDLLDLPGLESLVPGDGGSVRGIGRHGPPRLEWAASGTALCAVVKGDLVWVDLAAGTKRRLTEGGAPMEDLRIAPDGSRVSFARENDLWVVPTAEGRPTRLTQGGSEDLLNATLDWVYPEELGHDTAAWWSPDSSRIAYLQLDETSVPRFSVPDVVPLRGGGTTMRYPKAGDPNPVARVGVVPASGGATTWFDLGSPAPEYVCRVAWLPGSRRVAVVTLDRAQRTLRLLSCDAETGASTLLLEEKDDAWVEVPPEPEFVDDDRFLWRSHRDDAYRWWVGRLDPAGAALLSLEPLTPPGVDAHDVLRFDAKSGDCVYDAIERAGLRTRICVSRPADRASVTPAPFFPDAGMDGRASLDATGAYALVTVSNATTPPRRELRRAAGGLVRVLGDARSPELDALRLAVPEFGALEVPEGRLPWCLWKPPGLDESKRHPVIVSTYGGPGSRVVEDRWGRGPFFATLLAEKGYLVFELDNRGTGNQGARFERLVKGRLGMLELEDQARGVKMLCERPYVDASRVGIWGWSYGGTMACNALTRRSDVFKVGVAVAPVTDWRLYDTIYTERYMGLPSENAKGYEETSSVGHAAGMNGRLLLLHGMADDNVHVQNTVRLVDALLDAKKTTFETMLYPRRGHGIEGRGLDVFSRIVAYFDRWL